jgi:phytanoyl-CoA hydroxylase
MPTIAANASTDQLNTTQISDFERDGYLAFDGFLSPSEVQELNVALLEMVAKLHADAQTGEADITSEEGRLNHSGLRICDRAKDYDILLEPGITLDIHTASVEELDHSYRKISSPANGHRSFAALAKHPGIVGILDQLLGPDSILYGNMALCKPARIGVAKPWHQDGGSFLYKPYDQGVDVWIALDDATPENGCMYVIPGHHSPKKHTNLEDFMIEDGELDEADAIPVPMKAGSALFFSVMLPHFTPPNRSDRRRRAVQLFYRGSGTRMITKAEKRIDFVDDGTPAT